MWEKGAGGEAVKSVGTLVGEVPRVVRVPHWADLTVNCHILKVPLDWEPAGTNR